jgi:hypothetical protein
MATDAEIDAHNNAITATQIAPLAEKYSWSAPEIQEATDYLNNLSHRADCVRPWFFTDEIDAEVIALSQEYTPAL